MDLFVSAVREAAKATGGYCGKLLLSGQVQSGVCRRGSGSGRHRSACVVCAILLLQIIEGEGLGLVTQNVSSVSLNTPLTPHPNLSLPVTGRYCPVLCETPWWDNRGRGPGAGHSKHFKCVPEHPVNSIPKLSRCLNTLYRYFALSRQTDTRTDGHINRLRASHPTSQLE